MSHKFLDLVADSCNPIFLVAFLFGLRAKLGSGKPARSFLVRFFCALGITYLLSHVHQWFHLWPEHGDFVSGHMAFLITVATSFFLLDPRSLVFSLPFVIAYGVLIVALGYHHPRDLFIAAGMAVPVTLACHWFRPRKCFGESSEGL